jgi:hypothetical protein
MAKLSFGQAILLIILALPARVFGQEILAPDRDGPGYYAGDEYGVPESSRPKFLAWAESHRAQIREVVSRVERIKSGKLLPGCLNHDLLTCVASFAQTLAVTDSFDSDSLFKEPEVDINGRIIDRKPPSFEAFFRVDGVEKPLALSVHILVNPDMKVRALEIFFPDLTQPLFAKTQLEYEKTGVFELLQALSPNSCKSSDRITLYMTI